MSRVMLAGSEMIGLCVGDMLITWRRVRPELSVETLSAQA